jgi:hypothetical protein
VDVKDAEKQTCGISILYRRGVMNSGGTHKTNFEGVNMKKMILMVALLLVTGTACADEIVKGEFFVGGAVEPGVTAHPLISLKGEKFKGCLAHTAGKLSGTRLMLHIEKIDCNGTITKASGTVYDEIRIKGVDVTLARAGQLTIFPGQGVIVKLK